MTSVLMFPHQRVSSNNMWPYRQVGIMYHFFWMHWVHILKRTAGLPWPKFINLTTWQFSGDKMSPREMTSARPSVAVTWGPEAQRGLSPSGKLSFRRDSRRLPAGRPRTPLSQGLFSGEKGSVRGPGAPRAPARWASLPAPQGRGVGSAGWACPPRGSRWESPVQTQPFQCLSLLSPGSSR